MAVFTRRSCGSLSSGVNVMVPVLASYSISRSFARKVRGIKRRLPVLPLQGVMLFPNMTVPIVVNHPGSVHLVGRTTRGGDLVKIIYRGSVGARSPGVRSLCTAKIITSVIHILRVPSKAAAIVLRNGGHFRLRRLSTCSPCLVKGVGLLRSIVPSGSSHRFRTLISAVGSLAVGVLKTTSRPPHSLVFSVGGGGGVLCLVGFSYYGIPGKSSRGRSLLLVNGLGSHTCHLLFVLGQRCRLIRLGASVRVGARRSVGRRRGRCFLRRRVGAVRRRLKKGVGSLRVERLQRGTTGGG